MKTIRVNMKELSIICETDKYPYLGGRGYCVKRILEEVPPDCEPLGHNNKVIITGGLLNNLGVSGAERLSIGSKSPLTGGIKESNSGGIAALALCRQGVKSVIIEEGAKDNQLYGLLINNKGASLFPASDYRGLGNYELVSQLKARFGDNNAVISIGPAGEARLLTAAIAITDKDGLPGRFAARGGLGAVLGAKGIKAIVISNENNIKPNVKQPQKFKEYLKEYQQKLLANPITNGWFSKLGTAGMVNFINSIGGLPVKNFSCGTWEKANSVSGETIGELIANRGGAGRTGHPCMPGCLVRCSNIFPDSSGVAIVAPLEYETIGMMGINLDICDLDAIAQFNWICNDLGIDTIEVGGALGVAADCGLISFGDSQEVFSILKSIERLDILGRVIGNGAAITGKVLGAKRVPVVKGQTISAYDPRAIKGTGLTYATTPMGGDHTAGLTAFAKINHQQKGEEQIKASRSSQLSRAAFDTIGICLFHMGALLDGDIVNALIQAVYGDDKGFTDLAHLGLETIRMEQKFNRLAGITSVADDLSEFFRYEKLPPNNHVFDFDKDEIRSVLGDCSV